MMRLTLIAVTGFLTLTAATLLARGVPLAVRDGRQLLRLG